MSFCGVLSPSVLSSVVFPCWFPGSFLEAGAAQWPLRPSEGLAGVVVPHLLVAVRFLPTREGSGTKSSGRRPKNRASFRYHPSVRGTQLGIAVLIFWWGVLGLRFLAPPAVTSAIEVSTQTFRHWSKKSHAPPARPRNDPVRCQASSEKRISLSDGSSRSVAAYHEAAVVRSLGALPGPDISNNPELNCFLPLDNEIDFACLKVKA